MALTWLSFDKVTAAWPLTTVVSCLDDAGAGTIDANNVAFQSCARRAEAQVKSYLVAAGIATTQADDELLEAAALEFFGHYMFERHPEYVRVKDPLDRARRLSGAQELCDRIAQARQIPKQTQDAQGPAPTNGGVVLATGPRMYVPNTDGTSNSGDF
jgi:hypothetical protein